MLFALVFGFAAGLVVEWQLGWAAKVAAKVLDLLAKVGIDG